MIKFHESTTTSGTEPMTDEKIESGIIPGTQIEPSEVNGALRQNCVVAYGIAKSLGVDGYVTYGANYDDNKESGEGVCTKIKKALITKTYNGNNALLDKYFGAFTKKNAKPLPFEGYNKSNNTIEQRLSKMIKTTELDLIGFASDSQNKLKISVLGRYDTGAIAIISGEVGNYKLYDKDHIDEHGNGVWRVTFPNIIYGRKLIIKNYCFFNFNGRAGNGNGVWGEKGNDFIYLASPDLKASSDTVSFRLNYPIRLGLELEFAKNIGGR